jgi:hypothetical protein
VAALPILPSTLADIVPHRTRTDGDGFYELEVPADTPYRVVARAPGYEPQFYRMANHPEGAQWVDVAPGRVHDGVDFVLHPTSPHLGAIEGSVFRRLPDAECADRLSNSCLVPAAGALVRITAAFPTFAPMEIRTRTGRDGSFRVDGLLADDGGVLAYFVSAQIEDTEPGFYPGGVPFPQAEPLPVFPGKTSNAGRIVLPVHRQPPEEGFVGGWVTDPDGQPVEHALVRVYLQPERPDGRVAHAMTDAEGYFLVKNLPVGVRVLVSAAAEGYIPIYHPGVWRWKEAESVSTGGPMMRVVAVRLTLEPGASGGPFLQAGRVRVAKPDADFGGADPDGFRGSYDEGSAEIDEGFTGPSFEPLSHHDFLRGAFFYLMSATSRAVEHPLAGGDTGDNGAVILTGLPAGVYFAFADRPGFEPSFYVAEGEEHSTPIHLGETIPGILADIALYPLGSVDDGDEPGGGAIMVTNLTNVPNPFQPRTVIRYQLEAEATVTVQIFDYRGRIVRTLVAGQDQAAGPREVPWDGRNEEGKRVSSGVYFYRVQAGSYAVARKMVVLP